MTQDETLIRMANQIGTFFESMPDRPEALTGIATHLKNFWDPRMRRSFLALLESEHEQHIKPIVLAAVQAHRDLIECVDAAPKLTPL